MAQTEGCPSTKGEMSFGWHKRHPIGCDKSSKHGDDKLYTHTHPDATQWVQKRYLGHLLLRGTKAAGSAVS